jgi:hypothetical protein
MRQSISDAAGSAKRHPIATAGILALALAFPAQAPALDLVDHGPTFAIGYARERGQDMAFPSLGWRWRWGFGATVDTAAAKIGTRLTWYVEPMIAAVAGDENTAEFQVVPGIRIESAAPWGASATPYLEGGIGLMVTGLDDMGLGSNILFSDNVGLGITFRDSGWSVGYRYRHASHARIWAESNAGLDAHYLTVRYDIAPPR